MPETKKLETYPDISFIENMSILELQEMMIADYREELEKLTGKKAHLSLADPFKLILNACALQIYQCLQYIDRAGKQSFLKYAQSEFLDNLAALKGVKRKPPQKAKTTIRFTLSEKRQNTISVSKGTRVTTGSEPYFATTAHAEIIAGNLFVDIPAECLQGGAEGNVFEVGEINILVDPVPYIDKVENIIKPVGGAGMELDSSLAERVYLAPSAYSVAGPEGAYEYLVKTYDSRIADVKVTSPWPTTVDIRFILEGGEIPTTNQIMDLEEYLRNGNVRPLTDLVTVRAPNITDFRIDLDYWINKSDQSKVVLIKENVEIAVKTYIEWQCGKIGRDVNPDELIKLILQAGVKRVIIEKGPNFTILKDVEVARLSYEGSRVSYKGLEDD